MKCTHVAIQSRDLTRTIEFYQQYCGMSVVDDRTSENRRVVWLGWGEDPPTFVIVAIEEPYDQNTHPPLQHIGLAVDERKEVDHIHARAVADGIGDLWPPTDGGPIVGYFCAVPDPDGNRVEFSYGQRIG